MSRIRVYANAAERTRAYRLRLQAAAHEPSAPVPAQTQPPKRQQAVSRAKRVAALLADVQRLQEEYEHWLAALPESLQDSDLATRLSETIEQFSGLVDLIAEIQPPKGFGRD